MVVDESVSSTGRGAFQMVQGHSPSDYRTQPAPTSSRFSPTQTDHGFLRALRASFYCRARPKAGTNSLIIAALTVMNADLSMWLLKNGPRLTLYRGLGASARNDPSPWSPSRPMEMLALTALHTRPLNTPIHPRWYIERHVLEQVKGH